MLSREEEEKAEKNSLSALEKNNYPKINRLRTKKDFSNLRDESKSYSDKFFRVYYKKNNSKFSRIGISVSKKCGNAVFRNKVKRMTKESFRVSPYKTLGHDALIVINSRTINKENLQEYKAKLNRYLEGKK